MRANWCAPASPRKPHAHGNRARRRRSKMGLICKQKAPISRQPPARGFCFSKLSLRASKGGRRDAFATELAWRTNAPRQSHRPHCEIQIVPSRFRPLSRQSRNFRVFGKVESSGFTWWIETTHGRVHQPDRVAPGWHPSRRDGAGSEVTVRALC